MNVVWNEAIDRAVTGAIGELLIEFPGAHPRVREVLDDRGVVALLVSVGDGRLVAAVRSVDLAPVEWPWPLPAVCGVLVHRGPVTVDEVIRGLAVSV